MFVLVLIGLQFKALASQIHGYGNTIAEYGGEAHYSCSVANPTGVQQVTWQRLCRDGPIQNLATYTKQFGQQVNEPYRGKVIFTEASLNSTSISLSDVSWQDNCCYICSFHVYPDGSKRQQTCLSVQGISSVDTAYVSRNASEGDNVEVEFSCSATGKPAPTIEWDVSPGAAHVYQSQTETVTNSDRTFTSSHNIMLQVPASWSGHVDCLLNRGQRGQRRERIPFTVGPKRPKKKNGIIPAVCICSIIAVVVVVVSIMRKRLMCKGRNQILKEKEHERDRVRGHC